MRNPKNSWERSDSFYGFIDDERSHIGILDVAKAWAAKVSESDVNYPDLLEFYIEGLRANGIINRVPLLYDAGQHDICEVFYLGPNDAKLAQQLIRAGSEHRKFMRQIFVTVDITAPIFWWKEFSTYKVGTTANSTSTMHKLATTPITMDCFETGDFEDMPANGMTAQDIVNYCETLRKLYLETSDKRYWKELIRWLPCSWLQTRTVTMSYENLLNMYRQRKNHKLTEWKQDFISFVQSLPYAQDFLMIEEDF